MSRPLLTGDHLVCVQTGLLHLSSAGSSQASYMQSPNSVASVSQGDPFVHEYEACGAVGLRALDSALILHDKTLRGGLQIVFLQTISLCFLLFLILYTYYMWQSQVENEHYTSF